MSNIDKIKQRLDVAEVVGSYIKLDKAGLNFKAVCPFHNEKTPSFYVSPPKNIWHCFSCGAGGDIFSFVMEIEKVEFNEALKILAKRAGVELKNENPKTRSERERALSIMEDAKNFYKSELYKNSEVLNYLKERGLTDETIKEFELGYAKDGWRNIYSFLKTKGYNDLDIEKTGLIIKPENVNSNYYDRFRSRIMFPIFDQSGRIVAFGGRIFISSVQMTPKEKEPAKYINSPQTIIYDKSRILYNFNKAKYEIPKQDFCVLVEGYMDAIMSYQAGVKNTVAVSGTALTEEQINSISRLTKKVITSFDTDTAGLAATSRSISLLLSRGFEVKIVKIEGEKDPADFVKNNSSELWHKVVRESLNIIDFYLTLLYEKLRSDKRALIQEIEKKVFPYIAHIISEMEKSFWIKKIAGFTEVKEESVWEEFNKFKKNSLKNNFKQASVNEAISKTEKFVNEKKTRKKDLEHRLAGILFLLNSKQAITEFERIFLRENFWMFSDNYASFFKLVGEGARDILTGFEDKLKPIALELELIYNFNEIHDIREELKVILSEFKKEAVKEKREALTMEIKALERRGDKDLMLEKINEFHRLAKEF